MKNTYSTITILLFFYSSIFAQTSPAPFKSITDSLQFAFNNATTDTAKLSVLLKERAIKYIAQADLILHLYSQGIELAQKRGDKRSLAKLYQNTGVVYAYGRKEEGTAFGWYQKALQEAENIGYTEGCALSHYAMALVYDHQGFRDKMYQSFAQSLSYIERGYTPLLLRPLISVQATYAGDKRLAEAYALGKKTIALVEQNTPSLQDKTLSISMFIGTLNQMPNKQGEVKYYSDKIIQLLKVVDMSYNAETIHHAAKLCLEINQIPLAIRYAAQVLALKDDNNITIDTKAETHFMLAEIYEKQQNYPLSIQHYKDFMTLRTSIMKRTMTEEAGRKVIRLEGERDLLLKQQEIDRQKWFTILAVVIASLISALGIIVFHYYKREQARKQELTTLNATKDRLFAILSHDLLSPVATLKNYLSLIDWGMISQTEFTQSSDRLKIKVNNLYNLLENVLHWSITQMQGIKPKIEQVVVAEVINEQIKLLESIAKNKQISITQFIANDLIINVDKNHLGLIVRNVLQNALKFTHSDGLISFLSQHTEGGKTLIKITDNGIGMSESVRHELFKTDKNVHRNGTSAEGGTGLGLILTKELVELNGGTIDVESTVGQGTTFSLVF